MHSHEVALTVMGRLDRAAADDHPDLNAAVFGGLRVEGRFRVPSNDVPESFEEWDELFDGIGRFARDVDLGPFGFKGAALYDHQTFIDHFDDTLSRAQQLGTFQCNTAGSQVNELFKTARVVDVWNSRGLMAGRIQESFFGVRGAWAYRTRREYLMATGRNGESQTATLSRKRWRAQQAVARRDRDAQGGRLTARQQRAEIFNSAQWNQFKGNGRWYVPKGELSC